MLMKKCKHGYTLYDKCDDCGEARSAHPPRYSPKYTQARLKAKLKALKEEKE